jgi:hypothetical protein
MLAILATAVGAAAPAGAVTDENFQLRTGADLLALCDVAADDPLHEEAIHMCQGFGVGEYQTLRAIGESEKVDDFFCPPAQTVSRNEAFAKFVAWAKLPANAPHLSESPAALLGRYLITTWPCPKAATTGGAR